MKFENSITRRKFLRNVTVAGMAVPVFSGIYLPDSAQGAINPQEVFRFPKDLKNLTDEQKLHLPKVTLPPVVEDGSQAPIVIEMDDHPMDSDHYIKSIQILSFSDPVVIKGKFYFTPVNEVYVGTQIRLNGGNTTVWVVAECNKDGMFAVSKTVKVAAGGC
ncbi:MAG: thiosulfate oxidation carrier protein SoxY [SAR324 cluster bacterium]|nr:thiosulfate oxidation carrier protein SoxY [SAR324 cluster bacterium]